MRRITEEDLAGLVGTKVSANLVSFHKGLQLRGHKTHLDMPINLVMFLAQISHESADFRFDKEIWGPTPAQRRYDTRTDLGNTPEADGDGKLYMGRGPLQVTGKFNYAAFTYWCRKHIDPCAPDFVANPELLNTDPWEGLSAIWFWEENALHLISITGDVTKLTRRINGGFNGLADRQRRYVEIALRFLSFDSLREFQVATGLTVDGIAGPKTFAALHEALCFAPSVSFGKPAKKPRRSILSWFLNLFTLKG